MGFIFQVRHQQPKDVPFKSHKNDHPQQKPKYQNTFQLTCIVIVICMASLYYGTCLSMISGINKNILHSQFGDWAGQQANQGIIIGFFFIGAIFGGFGAKFLAQKLSRRQMLFALSCLGIVITGLLQIPNIVCLIIMRVAQGFVVGAQMGIVPMYIRQITPIDLRGSQGVLNQILIVVGVVLDYILKVAFTQPNADYQFHWRFVFCFSGLPCIIQVIVMLTGFVPQSPMSLIQDHKIQQAKQIMARFNVPQVLDAALAEMIRQAKQKQLDQIAKEHGVTHQHTHKLRQKAHNQRKNNITDNNKVANFTQGDSQSSEIKIKEKVQNKHQNLRGSVHDQIHQQKANQIYTKIIQTYQKVPNLKDTQIHRALEHHHTHYQPVPHVQKPWPKIGYVLGFSLHFMQQFSGMKMIVTQTSGIFYGFNDTLVLYAPLIANIAQLIATILSVFILKQFGRKIPVIGGNLSLGIVNLILAALFLAQSQKDHKDQGIIYGAFAMVILFEIIYALTIGPLVFPYVPQIMPKKWVPLASSMNWTSAAISVIVNPYVTKAVGSPYPVFFFFSGMMFIFFILFKRYLVQTKGFTPTQVAQFLEKK